jgi:hypothetical protein
MMTGLKQAGVSVPAPMQGGVGRVRDGGEGGAGALLTCPLVARGQDSEADFGDIW